MWAAKGNNLEMTQGDYGVQLPITINGPTFTASDAIKFVLKDGVGGATILTKTYTDVSSGTINLELTQAESNTLQPRSYVYNLDWYQGGNFVCNLVAGASFKVVGKA